MEDSSVHRRLKCLSRHFLKTSHEEAHEHNVLRFNSLSALDDEMGFAGSPLPVIIGGMVLDIHAKPSSLAQPRTTTPGKVHYVAGGVARNVAECMSKLGTKPFMISIIGLDMAGNLLMEYWKSAGLNTEGIETRQDIGTPVVCNLFDANGEVMAGVASVEAMESFLTEERIRKFSCNIRAAPGLMIDANLNSRALKASCEIAAASGIPVWFEPVSVAKSKRITSIVSNVTFTSPNEDELISMANALSCQKRFFPVQYSTKGGSKQCIEHMFHTFKPAMLMLLEKGVKVVVVTIGANGVFVCFKGNHDFVHNNLKNIKPCDFGIRLYEMITSSCSSDKFQLGKPHLYAVHFPSLPAKVVRLTGAGDCLVGGTLASICAGLDLMQSIAVGIASAKAAVEVEMNVPPMFHLTTIAENARLIYSLAKVVCDEPLS